MAVCLQIANCIIDGGAIKVFIFSFIHLLLAEAQTSKVRRVTLHMAHCRVVIIVSTGLSFWFVDILPEGGETIEI